MHFFYVLWLSQFQAIFNAFVPSITVTFVFDLLTTITKHSREQ
jgi:hypothetical protein